MKRYSRGAETVMRTPHVLSCTYVSLVNLILTPTWAEKNFLQPDVGLPRKLIETTGFVGAGVDGTRFMLQTGYDSGPTVPRFPVVRPLAEDEIKEEVLVAVTGALRKQRFLYIEAYDVSPVGKAS
jgi:hypothetical protein